MGKKEDAWIAKLAKKNAEKPASGKPDKAVRYDPTLVRRMVDEDPDAKRIFKEMKKREF